MKITTRELNALTTPINQLVTAATAVQTFIAGVVPPGPFDATTLLATLTTKMAVVQNLIPTTASSGTGASATTTAGAAAYRAKVEAGQDEV